MDKKQSGVDNEKIPPYLSNMVGICLDNRRLVTKLGGIPVTRLGLPMISRWSALPILHTYCQLGAGNGTMMDVEEWPENTGGED